MDLDKECYAFPKDEYGEAYWDQGRDHDRQGNHAAAEADYTNALRFNDKSAWLWEGRASVRYELGNYQGAIDDCKEAIARVPFYVNALLCMSKSLTKLGDHKTALGYHNEAIRIGIEPDGETFIERAELRYQLGDYAGAIADRHQAKHGYKRWETIVEVYYLAHKNFKQSRVLSGSYRFLTPQLVNFMLRVEDKRIRIDTVERRDDGSTVYFIQAEEAIWDFYRQKTLM